MSLQCQNLTVPCYPASPPPFITRIHRLRPYSLLPEITLSSLAWLLHHIRESFIDSTIEIGLQIRWTGFRLGVPQKHSRDVRPRCPSGGVAARAHKRSPHRQPLMSWPSPTECSPSIYFEFRPGQSLSHLRRVMPLAKDSDQAKFERYKMTTQKANPSVKAGKE